MSFLSSVIRTSTTLALAAGLAVAVAAEPALGAPTPAEIAGATKWTSAVIHTSHGDLHLTLDPVAAPITVANFVKLAQAKFYDNLQFHRVVKGFVVQGGDPNSREGADGRLGAGGPGYTIPSEAGPGKPVHNAGALAMADAGLNTAGSQFYLALNDIHQLDGRYTVFGKMSDDKELTILRQINQGERFSVEITEPAKTEPAAAK